MTETRIVRSFEEVPRTLYERIPQAGRSTESGKPHPRPSSPMALKELLLSVNDKKLFEDIDRKVELDFRFLTSASTYTSGKTSTSSIEECRAYFSKLTIPELHYAKHDGLRQLYTDTFREAVVKRVLLEARKEGARSLSVGFTKIANFLMADKDVEKWVLESDISQPSSSYMLSRYIEHSLSDDSLLVGIEVLDPKTIDQHKIQQYEQEVALIQRRFSLDSSEIERNRVPVRREAVQQTINQLRLPGKWIAMKASFSIAKPKPGRFKFESIHPVTEYWGETVRIIMDEVPESGFPDEFAAQYTNFVGRTRVMNVFGCVFSTLPDEAPFDFYLTPYAIF